MSQAARYYDTHFGRVPVDPVITMIEAFRAADAAYTEQTRGVAFDDDEALAAAAAATYEAPWDALAETPAATTSAGAIAALDLALSDGAMVNGEQAEALIRSARDFLVAFRASIDAAAEARKIADMPAPGMLRHILARLLFVGGDSGMALLALPVDSVEALRIAEIAAQTGIEPAEPLKPARWQMLREEAIAFLTANTAPRPIVTGARPVGEA